ncbi:MAG TPA: hypothetical protein VG939_09150 [Caulobacteraceae bacterium]|nr:hypothetical protein [Caulobacteraceae bacterium]
MILQPPPGAPPILQAATAGLLILHVAGGALGIGAGGVAMVAKKGGRLHQVAGTSFFVGMLAMSGVGAAVAPFLDKDQVVNTSAGLFTFYLVLTGWMTVQRRPGRIGAFEVGAFVLALGAAVAAGTWAWIDSHSAHPAQGPSGMGLYVISGLAALGSACDLNLILRRGLAGPSRLARHLWRMGTALVVATASFFLGQEKFLPEAVRGTLLPALPVFAALGLTLYWLIRTKWPARKPRTTKAQPVAA